MILSFHAYLYLKQGLVFISICIYQFFILYFYPKVRIFLNLVDENFFLISKKYQTLYFIFYASKVKQINSIMRSGSRVRSRCTPSPPKIFWFLASFNVAMTEPPYRPFSKLWHHCYCKRCCSLYVAFIMFMHQIYQSLGDFRVWFVLFLCYCNFHSILRFLNNVFSKTLYIWIFSKQILYNAVGTTEFSIYT